MQKQADLFDPDVNPFHEPAPAAQATVEVAAEPEVAPQAKPLAAPCGCINSRSKPCRRLATGPVLLDGKPFIHRGVPMLHCDPACWRDDEPAPLFDTVTIADDPDDYPADRDDPGPDAPPDYGEWSGWERADDDGFGAGDDGREEGQG